MYSLEEIDDTHECGICFNVRNILYIYIYIAYCHWNNCGREQASNMCLEEEISRALQAFKNVLNRLACCKYEICTECYLQLKTPPKHLAKAGFVQPEKPML